MLRNSTLKGKLSQPSMGVLRQASRLLTADPKEQKPIGGSLEEKHIENSSSRFANNSVGGIDSYACKSS